MCKKSLWLIRYKCPQWKLVRPSLNCASRAVVNANICRAVCHSWMNQCFNKSFKRRNHYQFTKAALKHLTTAIKDWLFAWNSISSGVCEGKFYWLCQTNEWNESLRLNEWTGTCQWTLKSSLKVNWIIESKKSME